jgi:hypothetical protein
MFTWSAGASLSWIVPQDTVIRFAKTTGGPSVVLAKSVITPAGLLVNAVRSDIICYLDPSQFVPLAYRVSAGDVLIATSNASGTFVLLYDI